MTHPAAYEVINYYTKIKLALEELALVPITMIQHEFSAGGTEFRDEYSFADCNIRLAHEDSTIIAADDFDKVFVKPMIIIYIQTNNNDIVTNGNMIVEFQILCNTRQAGRIKLDAYTQLCQLALNPDELGGFWHSRGLLPRTVNTTKPQDGSKIDADLQNRLVFRSVLAQFSILGELYGSR